MTDIIRHCPDCGRDRSLEQHHGTGRWCPDAAGSDCPEWYCAGCGAALLIGVNPLSPELAAGAELRDRVA
jgi:hypothetical protein